MNPDNSSSASGDVLAGLPQPLDARITGTKNYFAALENFQRTFAFRQGDRVLLLTVTVAWRQELQSPPETVPLAQ